jgi:hypothetical protein
VAQQDGRYGKEALAGGARDGLIIPSCTHGKHGAEAGGNYIFWGVRGTREFAKWHRTAAVRRITVWVEGNCPFPLQCLRQLGRDFGRPRAVVTCETRHIHTGSANMARLAPAVHWARGRLWWGVVAYGANHFVGSRTKQAYGVA